MGKFTVIADVGESLVRLLRENLCPEVILSPDSIGLCSPAERGDLILGLHSTTWGTGNCAPPTWSPEPGSPRYPAPI